MADFDINSILSSLSSEDIENLKKTAAEVLGNMGGKQEQPREKFPPEKPKAPDIGLNALGDLGMPDLSQLTQLLPIFQALNTKDERMDFINALRPLLSDDKKKKADEAMKLVRLLSVIPLLKERGLM